MQKHKLALFLIVCIVANSLVTADSVSAEDKFLVCPSKVGDIRLDWRPENAGLITVRTDGIRQAVCTYGVSYDNFDNPIVFVSFLIQWCEETPCDNIAVYSGHYSNAVRSEVKPALVAEQISDPNHPKIKEAAQAFQELKMNLLAQAEKLAILRSDTEEVEKTPMDEERERVAKQYPGLKNGYLLYAEGMVSAKPLTWALGEADYGHVGIYIGDYQVPEGKKFTVRDKAQVPLMVFRNGKSIDLKLGDDIIEGDWIIGAVVEMRWNGAVFTTVDGMKASARDYMQREPKYAWKTTKTPPNEAQVKEIVKFVLSKVELTENGELLYWPGKQGIRTTSTRNPNTPKELWDCVSLAEAAYESIGFNPTPEVLDISVSIQPQEQYDNIDRDPLPLPQPTDVTPTGIRVGSVGIAVEALRNLVPFGPRIHIKVESPVNLHLYDSQGRHVGITPSGMFQREIPNAYYYLEMEEYPQSILAQDADGEYILVTEAVGDGSFDLQIQDLNVRTLGRLTVIEFQDVEITKGAMGTLKIGSTDKDVLIEIDDDGDGETDRTIEPSSMETLPSSTGATLAETGLTFESRSKPTGSNVQIPLTMKGIEEEVGNMDLTLSYNTSVLQAYEVIKGGSTTGSLFDYNIQGETIKISMADSQGFSGDGSVAYVRFNVIGAEGSSSPLDIVDLTANRASDTTLMNITKLDGIFRVLGVGDDQAIADCNGDGKLTVLDALCALQMAVGKRSEYLAMDVNGDGQVTSLDARKILRVALGLETLR